MQGPVEYMKMLREASLALQKLRGKKGDGAGATNELQQLRDMFEPRGA